MRGFGWRYAFVERDWREVREWLGSMDWPEEAGTYLVDIIDSVIECGADEVLALTTSMHDLLVAPTPADDPPLDVVIVRAPGSLRSHSGTTVLIEHLSISGKDTVSERPVADAVALFWRFMDTEFGVRPRRSPTT